MDVNVLFSNIESLLAMNTELLNNLEQRLVNWGSKSLVGDILIRLVCSFSPLFLFLFNFFLFFILFFFFYVGPLYEALHTGISVNLLSLPLYRYFYI